MEKGNGLAAAGSESLLLEHIPLNATAYALILRKIFVVKWMLWWAIV